MNRLIQPYSMTDLAMVGHSQESVFVVPGYGVLTLQDCVVESWSMDAHRDTVDIRTAGNPHPIAIPTLSWLTVDLRLRASGGLMSEEVPRDLRLADDMTVRQLLRAVHRKLKRRG